MTKTNLSDSKKEREEDVSSFSTGFFKKIKKKHIIIATSLAICLLIALLAIFKPFGLFKQAEKGTSASSVVGYPKVGIWRPNFGTQSYADIARGDYVVMPSAADTGGSAIVDDTRISTLRGLNPNIILLDDMNSSELPYDVSGTWGAAYDAARLGAVDASWILTQVGSALSAPVDIAVQSLPVADVSKFRVNDLAILDHEYVLVTAVGTNSLTVKRGWAGSKVAAHTSGARVAAAVSGWPGSVKLDVSDNCPLADVGHGLERFRDWNVRRQAARFTLHSWNGFFVDLAAGDITYLRGTTAWRTIADRTNPTIETNYANFDTAWAAGMTKYLTQLRTAVGPTAIIMPNDAVPVYPTVNGAIRESFPKITDTTQWWNELVFGKPQSPLTSSTSYLDWLAKGLSPNLSTILTYETSAGLGPHPVGWTPNYQKFRYGLTTALLGNGYYSYEIAADRMLWFDEYDNAGQGKGYLGQPTGPAALAMPALTSPDVLSGVGTFDTQAKVDAVSLKVQNGAVATKALDNGAVRIDVAKAATDNDVHLTFPGKSVTGNTPYTVSFQVKSSVPDDRLSAWLQKTGSPYSLLGTSRYNSTKSDWQQVALTITPNASATDAALHLVMGGKVNSVWIKDVRLQAGLRADVYRRDYDNGIALVNTTNAPVTIPLEANFRKIKGTQDPIVNDGSLVTAVTLQAHDGIVLLRQIVTAPVVDTTPPVVTFNSPTNGATVSGTVSLGVTATDNIGVVKTDFLVDNALVGTATGFPFNISWDSSKVSPGSHIIKATAYDAAGNNASAQVTINVPAPTPTPTPTPAPAPTPTADTTPPSAILLAPTAGTTVKKTVSVQLSTSDTSGIQKVEYYIDNTLVSGLMAPNLQGYYAYSWNTKTYANGSHTIKVISYDNSSNHNQTTVSVTVTVSNTWWSRWF